MNNEIQQLENQFQKYVGQKILVNTKEKSELLFGRMQDFTSYTLAEEEALIPQIKQEAKELGLTVRVFLPGTMGTCDIRNDRLNISINRTNDGSFEITFARIG